ncbi:MAG: YggT family protein [Paraglaciecola psychrophila]|jgi:YggT family protein
MGALVDIGNLIIQTFFNMFILAVLLRLLLQLARADFFNPISQFLVKVTSPALAPLRRIVPSIAGIDMASIVLVVGLQILGTVLLVLLRGYDIPNPLSMLIWALLGTAGMVINIYFVAILFSIVVSWVSPGSYNPAVILLHQLTEPVMAPFRKLLPSLGGLDLSPIFVFLTINVLQILLGHLASASGLPAAYVIGM